jgi:hypothetical protein
MKSRGLPAIALKASNDRGGHYFMNLLTGKRIHGYIWEPQPIDNDVVDLHVPLFSVAISASLSLLSITVSMGKGSSGSSGIIPRSLSYLSFPIRISSSSSNSCSCSLSCSKMIRFHRQMFKSTEL